MDVVLEYTPLHNGAIMKPYQLYALLLAITHSHGSVPKVADLYTFAKKKPSKDTVLSNLSRLTAVVEDPPSEPKLADFVKAGAERTNVAEQRKKRFRWFCAALDDNMP